jgi:hypothetical protein
VTKKPKCAVKNCPEDAHCKGWCGAHYQRWRRHGDPEHLKGRPSGSTHYAWKGERAGYQAKHLRVAHVRGSAPSCIWGCIETKRFEWANLTGDYEDPDDYAAMCISCHRRYDDARRSMEEGFKKHPRGASLAGERNPQAKLTPQIAEDCRRRHAVGEQVADLAREYGVTYGAISLIIQGKHWKSKAA